MRTLSYIREFADGSIVNDTNASIFTPLMEPHQDVIRFSCLDAERSLLYTVGKQIFPHNFEFTNSSTRWTVVFVSEGCLFCGEEQLSAGDFVVIPPTRSYTLFSRKASGCYYWMTTNDEFLIDILELCGYSDEDIMKGHTDKIPELLAEFDRTIYSFSHDCDQRVYIIGRFSETYAFLSKEVVASKKVDVHLFKRILSCVEYAYGKITVNELAERFFISRRYLYAMFKKYRNISPIQYILDVRMKAADKFLSTTDFSIARIANLVGYSDYYHFTRIYKKYYSILPSVRRKQARDQRLIDRKEESNQ